MESKMKDINCPSNNCLSCPLRCHRKQTNPVHCEEALDILFESCSFDLGTEEISVSEALGRVTAKTYYAEFSHPAADGAHHDGIAVNHDYVEKKVLNGDTELVSGEYTFIGMNDPLPDGADTVIPAERIETVSGKVRLDALPGKGGGILKKGNCFKKGDIIVPEGHKLNPGNLCILRYSGNEVISVKKKPHAVIIPTGKFTVQPGSIPEIGEFIEADSLLIEAVVKMCGGSAHTLQPVNEDIETLCSVIENIQGTYDILFLIGGAGTWKERYHDYAVSAVEKLGNILVQGTDIGPGGKTHFFGNIGGKCVFGVPGPPHAAVTQVEYYIPKIMERFLGVPCGYQQEIYAVPSDDFSRRINPGYNPHVLLRWEDNNDIPTAYPVIMGDTADCFAKANAVMTPEKKYEKGDLVKCHLVYDLETAKTAEKQW